MNKYSAFALIGILGSTIGNLSFAKKMPVEQALTFVSMLSATSCKAQLPSQLIVEYYDKEQRVKRAKYYLVNNKKHGMYLAYYRDGVVSEQITYSNGVKNGKSIEYNSNGTVAEQTTYLNGVRTGTSIKYNSSGDVIAQADYSQGTMTRWVGYCTNSKVACSEVRMDGTNLNYYLIKEYMKLDNSALPYLAIKGVAANGRVSGTVALSTQQGPVPVRDATIGGIPQVGGAIEPEAFKRLIELKQEFEAGHREETCCGFVMIINYSNATIVRDKSSIYYEKYVFNPLIGKINYIDYYRESGHSYKKVGHQVVE